MRCIRNAQCARDQKPKRNEDGKGDFERGDKDHPEPDRRQQQVARYPHGRSGQEGAVAYKLGADESDDEAQDRER